MAPPFGFAPFWPPRRTRGGRRGSFALFAFILAAHASFSTALPAQQSKPQEYQVKAIYLYNFSKFVEWPASSPAADTFTVCVLGRDPFGALLDTTLAGEKVGDKYMVARRIADVQEAAKCRILFIASSEAARVKQILLTLGKSSVLTVSDLPDFSLNGGMVQFVIEDDKVRFEVNLTAAERAGLTLSSQLLKVATAVRKDAPANNVNP